mmetsp:Transcript_13494/g.20541  ORF Transcript_13494/g.20541 Transcript_13494/m.20541 type:complete len:347 (+) Transcript_13494:95-1135(+)|eukprot:CAMPEP_0196810166 /NCGR_PEP_ID=MMETSP1362-20130617/9996_1 /TAXON_ID=163516 /ORGANISM="Leptocylindrus danicus, Strain CCMP1856" /LENGTH=346 /DNA_ID=CAMNT_0042185059 /DNA_START=85 /DNA_END=1125 /DNA_ORIENTATION=-
MTSEANGKAENGVPRNALNMFANSNLSAGDGEVSQIDLDELFRDCYFGQDASFPSAVPSDSGIDLVPPPPSVPASAASTPSAGGGVKRKAETQDVVKPEIGIMPSVSMYGDAGKIPSGSTKTLTAAQKVERRERNREHAKRSRLRKKFLLESLQGQIHGLQSEIEALTNIIRKELPDKADELLSTVNEKPKVAGAEKFTPLPMPSGFGPVKTLMEPDFRLMSALSSSQQNFAISDPSLPDNPIVYVSQGFLDLTGYTLDQVLGRNCRFLQGPGTDQSAVDIIRKGVREGVDTSVCLLNYKADGTPFWNQFFVAALRDAENNVVNFVGVQCEVSKATVERQTGAISK